MEIRVTAMRPSDELTIRTHFSDYRFRVMDPVECKGVLSGGRLGAEQHEAVFVESRRGGPSAPWEFLGIDSESPYEDARPLLVAGQPEIREYRMRFWDKGTPNGDWTDVEYKGRSASVKHIRNASYCPACTNDLDAFMKDFNNLVEPKQP